MSPESQPDADRHTSATLPAATHAAALSIEVRTPLAQIELAASQLFREAATPAARAHSEQIFHAVAEIDELVERMLRVLVPPKFDRDPVGDLSPVLDELRRRFIPAFAACGVDWKCRDDAFAVPVVGSLERFRSLCTELLHLAFNLTGQGGVFSLELTSDGASVEATVFCRRPHAWNEETIMSAQSHVERSQAVALEGGGHLSGTISGRSSDLSLWISNDRSQASRILDATGSWIATADADSSPVSGAVCRES